MQRLDVGRLGLRRGVGDLLGGGDEVLALGDEVGLALELDEDARGVGDQTGGRLALGAALRRLGGALDAQDLDGLVEVAVGLVERLLAVHHAGAGLLAELLDVGSGEVSHVSFFLERWWRSGPAGPPYGWLRRRPWPRRW